MVRNIKEPVARFHNVIYRATGEIAQAIQTKRTATINFLKQTLKDLRVKRWNFRVSAQAEAEQIASTFLDKLVRETDEEKITEERIINELYQIAEGIESDVLRDVIEDYKLDRRGWLKGGLHYIGVKLLNTKKQGEIGEWLSKVEKNVNTFAAIIATITGLKLQRVQSGSITFIVRAQSLAALKELWSMYQTGELKRRFQEAFAKISDGQEIKFSVFIDENEYRSICLNLVHLSRAEFVSSGEAERPEKRRALSISSVDDLDREVKEKQELIRCMREVEDAAQREKEKRKAIEADMAQMVQENTSKIVNKLKKKKLTEKEREELLKLLVNHHKALLENVFCFEDSLRDKKLDFLTNIVHYLSNSVRNVPKGKEELAKLIPKYHEIMIKTIEQDPSSEKSYQALRDTTHDLLDGLRDFGQAKEEHAKLIPKYHEIMIKTIEQDPTSDKSYGKLKEMMCELQKLTSSSEIGKEEYAKLIPKYHEIMIKMIEQDPKIEKSYQALRDTTRDLASIARDLPDKGKEEVTEILVKYHTFLLKNIEQEPMSERSHNALIAATHDLSKIVASWVTDEGKQQLAKLLLQYYTTLFTNIKQDPMSESSLGALKTATDDVLQMCRSSEIVKQEMIKFIPELNENLLLITKRVVNESGSTDSGLDRLERVISILTSLVEHPSQDNQIIFDLIDKMVDKISQDTDSGKGLDRIERMVGNLVRQLSSLTDAGQKQLIELIDKLCNPLMHLEKLPYVMERIILTVLRLCENLSKPISDRIVTSLLSVIEAALRSNSDIPPPDFDHLDRLCNIVIGRMELTPIDKEELSCILTSLNKCFAALAAEIASPLSEYTRQGHFIMYNWHSMLDKQMKAFEEMIKKLQTSGV